MTGRLDPRKRKPQAGKRKSAQECTAMRTDGQAHSVSRGKGQCGPSHLCGQQVKRSVWDRSSDWSVGGKVSVAQDI